MNRNTDLKNPKQHYLDTEPWWQTILGCVLAAGLFGFILLVL